MSKTKCTNCDKEIETSKFFLHERYCSLNVRKCSICNEPVQRDEYEEHKILEHPKPKCTFCQLSFSNDELGITSIFLLLSTSLLFVRT